MCYTVTTLKPTNGTDDRANNTTNNRQKRQAVDQRVRPEEQGWISKGCGRRIPLLNQETQCLSGGKCEYACYKPDCNYMSHTAIKG